MRDALRSHTIEVRLAVVLAVLCIALSLGAPQFATLPNLTSLLNNSAVNLIWAVGLLVVLIAGGIDISFAVASSVVQYVAAQLLMSVGGGNWLLGFLADPWLSDHLHRGDHRHLQRVFRAADVLQRRAQHLQPAGLVDRAHLHLRT